MSNQFNNQRCSKCYQKYSGLKATCYDSSCNREHFFKKNGQLFCICCLMGEGSIKCQKCSKLITCLDEMGKWRRNMVLVDDHTYDINNFGCECRECNHSENKESKLKRCQGTISNHYNGGLGHGGSTQFNQCDLAVPTDEGDFCQHCKGQAETYQQLRTRIKAKEKQVFEKYRQAHEKAQNYWNSLSSSEREKECERLVENLKLGKYEGGKFWRGNGDMEGYGSGWVPDGSFWQIKNGKYVSSQPHLVPGEITEEFYEKMFGDNLSKELVLRDYILVKKDDNNNSLSVNNSNSPTQPPQSENKSSQISTNNHSEGNSSGSDGNKNSEQKIEIVNSGIENKENESSKNDNEALIIDLKKVKKITLTADGSLEIESNGTQNGNHWHSISQIITAEQVSSNQELQKIKNYCQKNNKSTLNQQELNSILAANSTPTAEKTPTTPTRNNIFLVGIIGGTLAIGIVGIGLLLKRRKNKNVYQPKN